MDYPNIEAMASGTISGKFTEWPRVRPEAKALLAELAALREENARLRGYMRPDQIEEAETVTKLIRERDEARAEVARLEGLILDWEENDVVDLDPLGDEARRIRAQREEGTWEGPNGASLRDLYGREEGK